MKEEEEKTTLPCANIILNEKEISRLKKFLLLPNIVQVCVHKTYYLTFPFVIPGEILRLYFHFRSWFQ